jgi:hypothetical protein
LKIHIVPFTPNNWLNVKYVTSPQKKKTRTHSKTLIVEIEVDEERTSSEEIGGGVREKEETNTKHVSFKDEPRLNIDQVINPITTNVPIQPIEKLEGGREVEVLAIEKYEPIDYVIEPITNP